MEDRLVENLNFWGLGAVVDRKLYRVLRGHPFDIFSRHLQTLLPDYVHVLERLDYFVAPGAHELPDFKAALRDLLHFLFLAGGAGRRNKFDEHNLGPLEGEGAHDRLGELAVLDLDELPAVYPPLLIEKSYLGEQLRVGYQLSELLRELPRLYEDVDDLISMVALPDLLSCHYIYLDGFGQSFS